MRPSGEMELEPQDACHAEARGFESHHPLLFEDLGNRILLLSDLQRPSALANRLATKFLAGYKTFAGWGCAPRITNLEADGPEARPPAERCRHARLT
jgi:hypothetical protein